MAISPEVEAALNLIQHAISNDEDNMDGPMAGAPEQNDEGSLSILERRIVSLAIDAFDRAANRNEGHTDSEREYQAESYDQAAQSLGREFGLTYGV